MYSVLTLHEMGELIEKMMIRLVEVYDLLLFIDKDLYDSKESIDLNLFVSFVVLPMKAHVKSDRCGSNIFP